MTVTSVTPAGTVAPVELTQPGVLLPAASLLRRPTTGALPCCRRDATRSCAVTGWLLRSSAPAFGLTEISSTSSVAGSCGAVVVVVDVVVAIGEGGVPLFPPPHAEMNQT